MVRLAVWLTSPEAVQVIEQVAKYRAYRWFFQEAGTNPPEFFEVREIALVA